MGLKKKNPAFQGWGENLQGGVFGFVKIKIIYGKMLLKFPIGLHIYIWAVS